MRNLRSTDRTGGSDEAGAGERSRAVRNYRSAVRNTGMVAVFGVAGIFVIEAFLPTTTEANRQGLFITAGLVAAIGGAWFGLMPRQWFGERRVLAAATIAELVLLAMVYQTGGLQSLQIGYLVLPIIALILSGSVRQVAVVGALSFVGVAALAIPAALTGDLTDALDIAISRVLLLGMVVALSAGVARATGRQRFTTIERAAGLADENVAERSMALTDALTNLPNRCALELDLARLVADAARTGLPFSVLAIDLDGLKQVNDVFGHEAGDVLLRTFGQAIRSVIRGGDIGLRIGGDEFLILLPRTDSAQTAHVTERLHLAAVAMPTPQGPAQFSTGIATLQPHEAGADVVRRADAALYAAKAARSAVQ